MHSQLTLIADQHIAELHRAADRSRLVHAATAGHGAATPVRVRRWLRRRMPSVTAHA